jgi:hypothetical protein
MGGREQLVVLKSLVRQRGQQRVSILRPGRRSPSEVAGAPRSGDRSSEIRERAEHDAASKEKKKFFFLASDEILSRRFSSSHGVSNQVELIKPRRRSRRKKEEEKALEIQPEEQG